MHYIAAGGPAGTPATLDGPVPALRAVPDRPSIVNVVILGDAAACAHARRTLSASTDDIRVVAEAATLAEAVGISDVLRPEIALIAQELAPGASTDACRRLLRAAPAVRIVMMGAPSEDAAVGALLAGAAGFVSSTGTGADLVSAIRHAVSGGFALDAVTAGAVVTRLRANARPESFGQPLSTRQQQVLALVAEGCTNQEIAAELSLAEKTVRNYVHQIISALGVRTRTAAALWAVERRQLAAVAA